MVTMNCDLCEARGKQLQKLRSALALIRDAPFSAVNDSDSLRHTIKMLQYLATEALK